MQCEIIAIGTELLLGQIQDTNSAWLGENLALIGIDNYYQTKIGDNEDRIVTAIRLALSRSDAIVCCGGLGPTQDDITRESIAKATNTELYLDEKVAEKIEHMFLSRGRHMTPNNLKQAMSYINTDTKDGKEFMKLMKQKSYTKQQGIRAMTLAMRGSAIHGAGPGGVSQFTMHIAKNVKGLK